MFSTFGNNIRDRAGGGGAPVTFPAELWETPDEPNAEDDEFDGDLSGWTRSYTKSSEAINPTATFSSGDVREDVNNIRESWLYLQPPADSTWYYIHKQFAGGGELPDGLYWARLGFTHRTAAVIDDVELRLVLSASDSGDVDQDNGIRAFLNRSQTATIGFRCLEVDAGAGGTQTTQDDVAGRGQWFNHIAILKDGDDYDVRYGDGMQWQSIGSITYQGTPTIDRVSIQVRNASTNAPSNMIMKVDFFRYTSTLDLP